MAKTYKEWFDELKKQNDIIAQQKIDNYNKTKDEEIKQNTQIFEQQIDSTKNDYGVLYDLNEVQRIINRRNITERMANLGLTDSGLNRTQQTATELSYSNERSKINRKEYEAVTSLKNQLAQYITGANSEKVEKEIEIRDEYDQIAAQQAQKLYDTELEAENDRLKIEKEAELAAQKAEAEAKLAEQKAADAAKLAEQKAADAAKLAQQKAANQSSNNSSTQRENAIKKLKSDFAAINKKFDGKYTANDTKKIYSELADAEKKHNLSAFECLVILSNAGLEYEDYCQWKSSGTVKNTSNNTTSSSGGFIAGVNYNPIWLRKDYV